MLDDRPEQPGTPNIWDEVHLVVRGILHVRYIFGFLAGGFLVSAPLRFIMDQDWSLVFPSLVLGLACVVGFLVLLPLSRIPWEDMRLPEYKLFELSVFRSALVVCCVAIPVFLVLQATLSDNEQADFYGRCVEADLMCLVFMIFGYAKVKVDTLLFPEFYGLERKKASKGDGLKPSTDTLSPAAEVAPPPTPAPPTPAEAASASPSQSEPADQGST